MVLRSLIVRRKNPAFWTFKCGSPDLDFAGLEFIVSQEDCGVTNN